MMMTSIFSVDVTDIASELSTRPVGAEARCKLLALLKEHERIEINFLNLSLTPSFADECVGRLAGVMGLENFKRRVKLINVEDSTRPLIKHVVLQRCSQSKNESFSQHLPEPSHC